MFELRITAVSKTEIVAGLVLDTGEVEVKENNWVNFTRIRIGFIFFTIDLTWFKE